MFYFTCDRSLKAGAFTARATGKLEMEAIRQNEIKKYFVSIVS